MDRTPHEEYRAKNSLEKEVSSHFKEELDAILSLHITPETIATFYDEALSKTILLIAKTVQHYKEEGLGANLSGKALEDAAAAHYGIPSVTDLLTRIEERERYIQELKDDLITKTGYSSEVFVPPTADERFIVTGSGNGFEEKRLIPRLLTLSYILEHDLGINMQDVDIVQGTTTDNMMRKHPYVRLSVPLESGDRIVYICEEEGNATFVFDKVKILEKVGDIRLLDVTDKVRYKEHIHADRSVGTIVRQSPTWREDVTEALTESFAEPFVEKSGVKKERIPQTKKVSPSDFEKLIPKKKEGWESASSINKQGFGNSETIAKFAETFRIEHSKWFEEQKPSKGHPATHYHPELVTKIKEHFKKQKEKRDTAHERKEGWESANSLKQQGFGKRETLTAFTETFRAQHPEWFEEQKTGGGKVAEHYHPELVAKLVERLTKIPKKKEGWESASSLKKQKDFGDSRTIAAFAETFRVQHPEWFEEQKADKGAAAEHYHPELVAKLIEHLTKILKKKEGWESASSIKEIVGYSSYYTINKFAETFRAQHPEWFEEQKNKSNSSIHYHPELVRKIVEHFTNAKKTLEKKQEKRWGWGSARSLMRGGMLGGYKQITKFAETFRAQHPEWFEEQKTSGGKVAEHYHPELVTKIVERFGRRGMIGDESEKEN